MAAPLHGNTQSKRGAATEARPYNCGSELLLKLARHKTQFLLHRRSELHFIVSLCQLVDIGNTLASDVPPVLIQRGWGVRLDQRETNLSFALGPGASRDGNVIGGMS